MGALRQAGIVERCLEQRNAMDISVIIPVFNERDNLGPLYYELVSVLEGMEKKFEIIFVDDGSSDGSSEVLEQLARQDARVRLIVFRRNYGQSAALQAGIDHAAGEIIVTLDADLQNDPADIPGMVQKLEEGYDLVHGWRRQRQDTFWSRRLPSQIANWLIGRVTHFRIHDLGCALKVMRRAIAQELELYGDMHRFVTVLAYQRGARCVEVETHHRPRRFGRSKYGLSRTLRVLWDLITVKYLLDYFACPMRLFGQWGTACWALSVLSLFVVIAMKMVSGVDMTGNPLLLLSVLTAILGVQFFSLGLLGEVGARIYFQRGLARNYTVRSRWNFESSAGDRRQAA
jgi:glycosyltransferase involved in cell wall biosynthesis